MIINVQQNAYKHFLKNDPDAMEMGDAKGLHSRLTSRIEKKQE
jgi:hypothetical protein